MAASAVFADVLAALAVPDSGACADAGWPWVDGVAAAGGASAGPCESWRGHAGVCCCGGIAWLPVGVLRCGCESLCYLRGSAAGGRELRTLVPLHYAGDGAAGRRVDGVGGYRDRCVVGGVVVPCGLWAAAAGADDAANAAGDAVPDARDRSMLCELLFESAWVEAAIDCADKKAASMEAAFCFGERLYCWTVCGLGSSARRFSRSFSRSSSAFEKPSMPSFSLSWAMRFSACILSKG